MYGFRNSERENVGCDKLKQQGSLTVIQAFATVRRSCKTCVLLD